MKLEAINIKRFRSMREAVLNSCGGFNVLIGKNNSGKSNVLTALNAFFDCIAGNEVVTLKPSIGKEIDFCEKNLDQSMEITIIFSMTLAERDELIRDIVMEAAQMKNAVDGLDPSLQLSLTISIVPPPECFAFVSKIVLVDATISAGKNSGQQKILFNVSQEAARELFGKLAQARKHLEEAEALNKFLTEIKRYGLEMFNTKASEEKRSHLRYYLDAIPARMGIKAGSSLLREIESMIQQASSYEEYSSATQNLITRMQNDAVKLRDEPLRNKVVTFAGEQVAIPTYVKNLLARISKCKVLYLRERRKQIGREEATKLLSLKVTRGGPQVLRNIQETVSSLLGVQIDAFESEVGLRKNEPTAEMDVDNFLADVNGSGIREALRIVLDFEFEHPAILLIEEPEIYLHPSLETSMMRYLKRISADCQVFISTHSTNFLDTGEMKNVYLVSKSNSTQIQLLDYEEAESQIPRELGIRLSSLFMFDRLIFVEGSSDEAVFREWATALRVNFSHHNVGFIHMGGVRNFTHFAAKVTLSFLTKRQVKMWFIIDRDERDEQEISKLQGMAGDNANVKVLTRREIENYLLSPAAIAKFIGLKRSLSNSKQVVDTPSEVDIKNVLDDCAENLKQLTSDKQAVRLLCPALFPDHQQIFDVKSGSNIRDNIEAEISRLINQLEETKKNLEPVYKEQVKNVSNTWAANKYNLVPGDLLLDLVSQRYGARFKKEQDSPRLARFMTEDEIPQEIQHLIREIGM